MSNVRFLDQVAVTSFAGNTEIVGAAFPRVVFAGETKVVATNSNSYALEVFNLGNIVVTAGSAVTVAGEVVYSHGVLRIEDTFTNQGTINVGGILEIGELTP
jgi:hypothetical protein